MTKDCKLIVSKLHHPFYKVTAYEVVLHPVFCNLFKLYCFFYSQAQLFLAGYNHTLTNWIYKKCFIWTLQATKFYMLYQIIFTFTLFNRKATYMFVVCHILLRFFSKFCFSIFSPPVHVHPVPPCNRGLCFSTWSSGIEENDESLFFNFMVIPLVSLSLSLFF